MLARISKNSSWQGKKKEIEFRIIYSESHLGRVTNMVGVYALVEVAITINFKRIFFDLDVRDAVQREVENAGKQR